MGFLGPLVIALVVVAFCYFFMRRNPAEGRVQRNKSVVDFSYAGNPSKAERLALRAGPNQRLVPAYGIKNSFTTTDVAVHQDFLKRAIKPLNQMTPNKWQKLYKEAVVLLDSLKIKQTTLLILSYPNSSARFLLARFVRGLCLRVVLDIVFGIEPSGPHDRDIDIVTSEINLQWIKSKGEEGITRSATLHDTLGDLIANSSNTPELSVQESLALILPSYETLWRVVLLTFTTMSYRTASPAIDLAQLKVPKCLGDNSDLEKKARNLAKVRSKVFIQHFQRLSNCL
jgi:hypothetical protein